MPTTSEHSARDSTQHHTRLISDMLDQIISEAEAAKISDTHQLTWHHLERIAEQLQSVRYTVWIDGHQRRKTCQP